MLRLCHGWCPTVACLSPSTPPPVIPWVGFFFISRLWILGWSIWKLSFNLSWSAFPTKLLLVQSPNAKMQGWSICLSGKHPITSYIYILNVLPWPTHLMPLFSLSVHDAEHLPLGSHSYLLLGLNLSSFSWTIGLKEVTSVFLEAQCHCLLWMQHLQEAQVWWLRIHRSRTLTASCSFLLLLGKWLKLTSAHQFPFYKRRQNQSQSLRWSLVISQYLCST